jgi:uncharacterized protein with FMN-binding domain
VKLTKPVGPKEASGSTGRVANGLVALSSAAVLTVYGAGYLRTRAAAERLEAAERPRIQIPDALGDWTQSRSPAPAAIVPAVLEPQADVPDVPNVADATSASVAAPDPVPGPAPTVPASPSASRTQVQPLPAVKKAAEPAVAEAQAAAVQVTPPSAPQAAPAALPAAAAAPAAATPVSIPAVDPPPPVPPVPPVDTAPQPTAPPAPQYKDGTYSGWGTSRHGDIKAAVVVDGGRIVSAVIAECWTRYSCSWVAHLQGQVVARQSQEVDYVSGATQSANAFYYAVSEALSKAK